MRALPITGAKNLSIGELSRRASVSIDAIRYYESIKLLRTAMRSVAGRRIYAESDVRVLLFIRRARELGLAIDQIRVLLRSGAPEDVRCDEMRQVVLRHLDRIHAQITDLTKAERLLIRAIGGCSGDATSTCPVVNFLIADPKENRSTSPNQI